MLLDGIKRALVVAAHPDDEILGCGGTVARLTSNGARVTTLILATGALSRTDADVGDVARLRDDARKAATVLGGMDVRFGDFPDNAMDTVPLLHVTQQIEHIVRDTRPELVLTHASVDLNIDHRVARSAVLTACRPLAGTSVRTILAFETLSSSEWADPAGTPFNPTVHVDISAHLERKIEALRHYETEMRPSPHPRSYEQVRELAHVRGRNAGLEAAEGFELVRALEV